MKINNSEFKVIIKEGKLFVEHFFKGKTEELMTIYGINSKPYVKRMGTKMYLPEELITELKEVA